MSFRLGLFVLVLCGLLASMCLLATRPKKVGGTFLKLAGRDGGIYISDEAAEASMKRPLTVQLRDTTSGTTITLVYARYNP